MENTFKNLNCCKVFWENLFEFFPFQKSIFTLIYMVIFQQRMAFISCDPICKPISTMTAFPRKCTRDSNKLMVLRTRIGMSLHDRWSAACCTVTRFLELLFILKISHENRILLCYKCWGTHKSISFVVSLIEHGFLVRSVYRKNIERHIEK